MSTLTRTEYQGDGAWRRRLRRVEESSWERARTQVDAGSSRADTAEYTAAFYRSLGFRELIRFHGVQRQERFPRGEQHEHEAVGSDCGSGGGGGGGGMRERRSRQEHQDSESASQHRQQVLGADYSKREEQQQSH